MTKIAQSRPQEPPSTLPKTAQVPILSPKRHSGAHFYTSAIFAKIGPKTPKNTQDSSQNGLKMASQALSWAILAPSCPHLAAKFAQLAAILGSPRLSKIDQNLPRQPPGHFSSQWSPPRPPRPPPGLDFPGFGVDFSTFLARFFLGFCFQFLAFSVDFLRGLT